MRHLRFTLSVLTLALVVAVLRVDTNPAAALTAESVDRTGITDAQLEDLAQLAKQRGLSLAEAVDRYAWIEDFSIMADTLRKSYPNEFAGAAAEPFGGARAWIGFRGEVPHEATTLANGFRESVALRGNLGHFEAELDNRIEKAHFAVWERQDLVEHVSSHYDLKTGRITIAVEPAASLGIRIATERVQFRDAVRASLPDEADGWEVTIVPVDRLTSGEDTVYGGKPLSTCTSGFTVTKGSERGITTAAHCGDTQKYGSLSLTFKAAHKGTWGDVQWHTSSDYEADDFYSTPNSWRDVAARGALPSKHQPLCMNGMTTGYHCDTVFVTGTCDDGACHLVGMYDRNAAQGDSGGPWFYGNTAYGIHHGPKDFCGITQWECDTFSYIGYLSTMLGVQVATS